jgi:hypothetical protein
VGREKFLSVGCPFPYCGCSIHRGTRRFSKFWLPFPYCRCSIHRGTQRFSKFWLPFSKCQTPSAVAGSLHHSYRRRIPLPLLSLTNPSSLMCYAGPRCRSGSHCRHHAFTDGPPPCQGAALGVGTIWVPVVGTS